MDNTARKIRVAHVITCLTTGGAEMMLYKLLAHTDLTHFEPVVISLRGEADLSRRIRSHGISVYSLNMSLNLWAGWRILELVRLLRELQPDIVQGWMYHGNLAASLANMALGDRYPLLWNIRQTLYDIRHEPLATRGVIRMGAKLSKRPEHILYNSYLSADQHAAFGYPAQKTQIVPNGFDIQRFSPNAYYREDIRESLGIPSDALVIGMIARYHPMKNHALFLEAASLLMQHQKNVHFILAGREVTAENPELIPLLQRFPDRSHLHLLGERQDVYCVLNALDIFSLTSSRGEGFPNAIGEAMACGVPCIATDVGDIPLIIGKTGRVLQVPEATPSALAFAWLEWINAGEVWRKELGLRALQRIRKHYNIQNITTQYQNIYKELVNHVRTDGLLLPLNQTKFDRHAKQSAPDDIHPRTQGAG
ncbi:glycosyltransferase [Candidatus Thiothrix sp. Deng01]|uniref:Glycosyltransferase n=1 Tax=Candidatus Thiothrix phosphatis TaxID=3112415 RepID=A0ABU6D1P3_9GAMM|nr:glycosyltransferase [Candidatus Thiothrix sp. Deng01]MEB4592294.1 glycosyltransferase [Candidatus Thiothrix sp. Deng01]